MYIGKGVIIGTFTGLLILLLFIGFSSGMIQNYKTNFQKNFSQLFRNFKSDKLPPIETPPPDMQYATEVANSTIISLDDMNESQFASYKDGIICAKMNHLTFINNDGTIGWETDTAIVDPILKTEGGYILLAEKNRNKICMYNDRKLIYDIDDPDTIIAAEISSAGDAVIITDKSSYKGGISVYNKTGARIFSWASGSNMVISADISAASRRVAVSLLNTDVTVGSVIMLFDVNKTESDAKIAFDDTVIFNMHFIGDLLCGFGDNRIIGITAGGRVVYNQSFENEQLTHCAIDTSGNKLVSLDDGNIPIINMYSKRGSLTETATLTGVTDFIDIKNKTIVYNLGRDVYFGKINSGSIIKYTSAMDIKDLIITSSRSFVIVYSNSVEFVTV
ncbi:hypothetical protein FMM68_01360 [Lachnospiraceae bacterium MD329]|jgi:hypothetical protein|nr:hypothetical protein [Lachnospiraceae bacterium MD329]